MVSPISLFRKVPGLFRLSRIVRHDGRQPKAPLEEVMILGRGFYFAGAGIDASGCLVRALPQ